MIYAAAVVWWLMGVGGFIYWWTNEFDLEVSDLVFSALPGLLGPGAWALGWVLHGGRRRPRRVLMSRRGRA